RNRRPGAAAPQHPGRVDDVCVTRGALDPRRGQGVTDADRQLPRGPANGVRLPLRSGARHRHGLGPVAAREQEAAELRRVRRWAAPGGRPHTGDDDDLQRPTASAGLAGGGSASSWPRRRETSTVQTAASTTAATTNAAAAPVAPYAAPRTTSVGSSTASSAP